VRDVVGKTTRLKIILKPGFFFITWKKRYLDKEEIRASDQSLV